MEALIRCGHQACRQAWLAKCRVNQGHPPSVDRTVINPALFSALPGKVLENWVGLARWRCSVRTDRFGEEMPLGIERDAAYIGGLALWL